MDIQLDEYESEDFELKMWLDENAPNEVQGQKYDGKIVVSTVQTNADLKDINLFSAGELTMPGASRNDDPSRAGYLPLRKSWPAGKNLSYAGTSH